MNSQFGKILSFGIEIWCQSIKFGNEVSGRNKLLLTSCHFRHYTNYPSSTNLVGYNSRCFVAKHVNTRFYAGSNVRDVKATREAKDKANKLEKFQSKKQAPKTILLITDNNKINVVSLEEAGRMAKKSGLHLIEVDALTENLKTDKQVYKLISSGQFFGDDMKHKKDSADEKKKGKDEKTITLKSKTSEHDVIIKIKHMKKLVEKGHIVRVFIGSTGDGQNPETVFKIIENNFKGEPIRIVQKVTKSSQIKFQLMPPKAKTVNEFAGELKIQEAKKLESEQQDGDNNDDDDSDDDDDDHKKQKVKK